MISNYCVVCKLFGLLLNDYFINNLRTIFATQQSSLILKQKYWLNKTSDLSQREKLVTHKS